MSKWIIQFQDYDCSFGMECQGGNDPSYACGNCSKVWKDSTMIFNSKKAAEKSRLEYLKNQGYYYPSEVRIVKL